MKKYKEYFEAKGIIDIISEDELEDQFLRLKEILAIHVQYKRFQYNYLIDVFCSFDKKDKAEEEIDQIKYRMETMFNIKFIINYKGSQSRGYYWQIFIGSGDTAK